MAVKIRLSRKGRKKIAVFDMVVADTKAPRDGRFIEKLGIYNPNTYPKQVEFDEEKAFQWIMKGAQPTDTVRALLSQKGIMLRKHLQMGVNKGAISQEEADKKYQEWKAEKEKEESAKMERIAQEKEQAEKERLEKEAKINRERAEMLKKKSEEEQAEAAAESTEGESGGGEQPAEAEGQQEAEQSADAGQEQQEAASGEEQKEEAAAGEEEKQEAQEEETKQE